jgi:hypothetical protein
MKRIKGAGLVCFFLTLGSLPASAAPNFLDFYYPIVKEGRIDLKFLKTANGAYPLIAEVNLVVRVHSNSLTGFRFVFDNPGRKMSDTPCQDLQGVALRMGNTDYSGGEGSLAVLSGLRSRVADSDWFLETYKFDIQVPSNSALAPCLATYRPGSLFLRDISGKFKSILFNYGSKPFYEGFPALRNNETYLNQNKPIPEFSCERNPEPVFNGYYACVDNLEKISVPKTFTQTDIDQATKDNEAFRIKVEADRAAADKAAADKAAADKAAADAKKKTTITCVKGKLTKKVTAVNPKCPSGYKKK